MGVVTFAPPAAAEVCPNPLDQGALKDALARLASGLTLIACWDGDTPKGLVATSFIGLSVSPPRVLFSVRHEASAHEALLRATHYSAAILSEADREVADAFSSSTRSEQRFAGAGWRLDDLAAPRYLGGLARFELRTERRIGADSHTIFIAEVVNVVSDTGAPLVFFERGLSSLAL